MRDDPYAGLSFDDAGRLQPRAADPWPPVADARMTRWEYIPHVLRSGLSSAEVRVLVALAYTADPDLSNAWTGISKVAQAAGRGETATKRHIAGLEAAGWIRRIPFRRNSDGNRTTSLIQFRIPPGPAPEFEDGRPAWDGPVQWDKRDGATPARRGHPWWS
ncbi:MAG: hypothetical protein R6U63_13820 [Longimicrobiales bacterium]